jgi:hypothetical protein
MTHVSGPVQGTVNPRTAQPRRESAHGAGRARPRMDRRRRAHLALRLIYLKLASLRRESGAVRYAALDLAQIPDGSIK